MFVTQLLEAAAAKSSLTFASLQLLAAKASSIDGAPDDIDPIIEAWEKVPGFATSILMRLLLETYGTDGEGPEISFEVKTEKLMSWAAKDCDAYRDLNPGVITNAARQSETTDQVEFWLIDDMDGQDPIKIRAFLYSQGKFHWLIGYAQEEMTIFIFPRDD